MKAHNDRAGRRLRLDYPMARVTAVAATALLVFAAHAGDDHGTAPAAAASAAMAELRFAAESESFELVGKLEGTRLVLWLDRWADNTPVRDARIDLDVGGAKVTAKPRADDIGYEAQLPAPLPEGIHPVSAAISVGKESDLLAGELDIHGIAKPQGALPTATTSTATLSRSAALPWVAGAVLLAAAAGAVAFTRRGARRQDMEAPR